MAAPQLEAPEWCALVPLEGLPGEPGGVRYHIEAKTLGCGLGGLILNPMTACAAACVDECVPWAIRDCNNANLLDARTGGVAVLTVMAGCVGT